MAYYMGLDLGGTNIKAGVIDQHGRLLVKVSLATRAAEGPDAVMGRMVKAAGDAAEKAELTLDQIDAIGIGSPGPLDMDGGVVVHAPNLPGWSNIPLRQRIREGTGRPTILENDANAAAFGEFFAGAGRDPAIRHLVMLTLGTGVGSGIIVDGRLIHGAYQEGGEGGRMIVVPDGRPCGCGQRGCLETYASASRTALRAREAIEAGEPSSLCELYDRDPERVTSHAVFDHAKAGDALALRVVDEACLYLGIACVNICRLLDPQMIVFAGGMTLAGDFLFDRIKAAFRKHTWTAGHNYLQIVPAMLGNDAGVIGAAAVALDAHQAGAMAES